MLLAVGLIVVSWLWEAVGEYWATGERWIRLPMFAKSLSYAAVAVLVLIVNSGDVQTFIYFRF